MATKEPALERARGLTDEIRHLEIQVLQERMIGLKAQEKLAQVLITQTEKELAGLQGE